MERRKRGKTRKKKALLGNHQRCWLWGRHTVGEILDAGRWPVAELLLADTLPEDTLAQSLARAEALDIPVSVEPAERLAQLCQSSEHQGYLARMAPFPYADPEALLTGAQDAPRLHAMLDRIQDPHNFGAIIRSAEVLGVQALWIGERNQAEVSSMVARSSSGAVNRIPIAQMESLPQAARAMKDRGFHLAAATEKAPVSCAEFDFRRPVTLVLGNEARGVSEELLAECDDELGIPQHGHIGSLNVAAAAAILFYEAQRQRAANT